MTDEKNINNSLKNQDKNFNKNSTHENNQIIIDGVDVSKCYRYQKKTGYCKGAFKPEELPFCENFDCEFKRLARKTQECEGLKKQLETSEEWRIKAESLNEKFELRNTCYRKALEEIEEYCNNVLSFTAVRTTESDILNIINKAKGEGDEDT